MQSLAPSFLAALRYGGLQLATLRALGEYQGKQKLYATQSPETLAELKQVAIVESTESSNRLEGVVVAPSPQPFSISEIEESCPGISRDMVRLVLRDEE